MRTVSEREPLVGGFYVKLSEPALEFCVSPETWQCAYGELAWRSNGEIQRSAGVSGRRSRMLDFRRMFPISAHINKGGTAEDSVPDQGMEPAAYHPFVITGRIT